MYPATGNKIEELVVESSGPVLAVTPFITRPAMQHLIQLIEGRRLVVVTDWPPTAVASGSTDPGIFDDLSEVKAPWNLWLLPGLHGKLFWTNDGALVGSTNLTSRGTGWFGPCNLELLVRVASDQAEVKLFIEHVSRYRRRASAADVDAAIYAAKHVVLSEELDERSIPFLRTPLPEFFDLYLHRHPLDLDALADANTLSVPSGLDGRELVIHLRRELMALPFYKLATLVSARTATVGDVARQAVEFRATASAYGFKVPPTDSAALEAWEILMGWLTMLFPSHFQAHRTGRPYLVSSAGAF